MADLYPTLTGEIKGYVDQLKAKGAQFSQAYAQHMQNYEYVKNDPALLEKWQNIKNYADKVKDTIQTINNAVDSSVSWVSGAMGLSGMSALPAAGVILSAAYLVGAIAALTWVINQIYQFNTLVNKGATVDQLTQQSTIGQIVQWGVIGFAVYMVWKKWGK